MKEINPKILIVDDNPKNIQVLASFLTTKGYELEYSTSGAEALEWIDTEDFDLVLLDIMMPEMDGFEVCEKIKSNPKNLDLPIIFLTAKTDIESISLAFKTGGVDYISKPFNSEELLARVSTHLILKQNKDKLKEMNLHLEDKVKERTHQLNLSLGELAKANVELKNLDQAKSEFMMILSHEIRTPLNGILGGIQILKEFELPEETLEFLRMLDDSTKRLESFSMRTLEISQLRTMGKELLKIETLKINELLSYLTEKFSTEIQLKKLKIKESVNEIYVIGDLNYLNSALYQLFDNAIYHSPENGIIEFVVEKTPDKIIFTISDQGKGFSDKILGKPIKTFYGDSKNVDGKKGLGLYLANIISKAHDGNLNFGNKKEGGAYVCLELPVIPSGLH